MSETTRQREEEKRKGDMVQQLLFFFKGHKVPDIEDAWGSPFHLKGSEIHSSLPPDRQTTNDE